MKRICYLLTIFLTGFSIAANQDGARNTYLVADNYGVYETELDYQTEPDTFWQETSPETPEFIRYDQVRTRDLICCVRK